MTLSTTFYTTYAVGVLDPTPNPLPYQGRG